MVKNKETAQEAEVLEGEIVEDVEQTFAGTTSPSKGFGGLVKLVGSLAVLLAALWFGFPLYKGFLPTAMQGEQQLESPAPNAIEAELELVKARLSQLEASLVGVNGELSQLQGGLEEVSTRPAQVVTEVDGDLLARIEAIEALLAERAAPLTEEASQVEVAELSEEQLALLEERLLGLEVVLSEMKKQELEASPLTAVAQPTDKTMPSVEANYFMSLVSLSRAVSAGKVYETELLSLEAFAGAGLVSKQLLEDQTKLLKPLATKGVPTDKQIMDSFVGLASVALSAESLSAEMSWWQRLLNNLKSMVSVRKKGEVEGEDIAAVLARAEVRLGRGDYQASQEILLGTTLLEQQALAPVIEMIDQRLTANNAISSLLTISLNGAEQE